MLFRTAYHTTACQGFQIQNIETILESLIVQNELHVTVGWDKELYDTSLIPSAKSVLVPSFNHPMEIKYQDSFFTSLMKTSRGTIVIDVRPFGMYDQTTHQFKPRNLGEYDLLKNRGQLNAIWINDTPKILRDMSGLPMAVFASWLSEATAKRFGLEAREQLDIYILAGLYYQSLFSNDTSYDEREKLRLINTIKTHLRVGANDAMNVIDRNYELTNIGSFCEAVKDLTQSVRLRDYSPGLVFSIIKNTWFGTNGQEIAAVAIEHPPTWMALIYAAFSERSFHNSGIAKIVERGIHKQAGEAYVLGLNNLFKTHCVPV